MRISLTQLSYMVAVDTYRNFSKAAEHCNVSQPTLSMQLHKAEEELGVHIFDRSKQPVVPTEMGELILLQARKILHESSVLDEMIRDQKDTLEGDLKLAIIPTLAPYLVPLFLQRFFKKYPKVQLTLTELTTDTLVEQLKKGLIDVGLLVTPLNDPSVREDPLFYEAFVVYAAQSNALHKKRYVLAEDIDVKKLWLLEEGHCFRSQILNLCELREATWKQKNFHYEAGSIETLRKMVEMDNGITILPELAVRELSARQRALVHFFKAPVPVREVSLVTHRDYVKKRLINALRHEILGVVPEKMARSENKRIIEIEPV